MRKKLFLFVFTIFITGNVYPQESDFQASDSLKSDFIYWRFSLDGGYSYRMGKNKEVYPDMKSYAEGLRSGYNISGKAMCYINKYVGFGLNVSVSKYSNEADKLNEGREVLKNVSDDITIGYVAPCIELRAVVNERHSFPFDFNVGYLWYNDEGTVYATVAEISGATVGFGLGAGYDFSIIKNIAFGVKMSLLVGRLSSYDLVLNNSQHKEKIELDSDNYESLSQFNLSAGVRFNF